MNKHSRSKSGLFLMELIIVILFFSISAAICMRIFSTAKIKSDYSRDISNASVVAQSCADSFKAYNGDPEKTAIAIEGAKLSDSVVIAYYDSDWKRTDSKNKAEYSLILKISKDNDYKTTGKISVENNDGKNFIELTVVSAHQKLK